MDATFRISDAVNMSAAYGLVEFFDKDIEALDYRNSTKVYKGSKESLLFFESFFSDYKMRTDKVLIFCRFINEYGCSPMHEGKFKEFSANHDFIIYLKNGKIEKIEVFSSLSHTMRFYVEDFDADYK